VSFNFSIEGFSFSFGDGGFSVGPSRPSGTARACFYEDVNFRGDSFCLRPGQSLRSLGDWNDEISSIDLSGGAEALVCEDATADCSLKTLCGGPRSGGRLSWRRPLLRARC
jgi:hypothetical protein